MSSMVAKYVGKKILGETITNNFGSEDPYFETVPATKIDGRSSHKKQKPRRKALPPGISEHDGKVLTKVKRRAYRLDMGFGGCCGIKFGYSSVIGIIPVIGDFADALLAMMVLQTCRGIEGGLPAAIQMQMLFNIALDFGIGLVPFLGDVADAVFRANTRNAVVLEKYLRQKGALALKKQGNRGLPYSDPSDPNEFERQEESPTRSGPPPAYTTSPSSGQGTNGHGPERQTDNRNGPQASQQQDSSRSWFGFGKSKQPAVPERGNGHEMSIRDDRQGRGEYSQDTVGRNKSTLQKSQP